MNYNIKFKKSVKNDLKNISKRDAVIILEKIEKELSYNADSNPFLKGKFASLKKFRVGNYRIVYSIINKEVLILRIKHRKEAYK